MPETSPAASWREAYQRDGFANVGCVLEPGEVFALKAELDRFVDSAFRAGGAGAKLPWLARNMSETPEETTYQFVNLWEVSDPFRSLASDGRIVEAAAALASTTQLQVFYDQVQYKAALRGGVTAWHQDAVYWPIEPAIMLTAWIALDDADVDNGCMWMVPGSHRWGRQIELLESFRDFRDPEHFGSLPAFVPPPGTAPWRGARPCPVRAGEVHFHHCMTWHGSPTNRTAHERRAFAVHYMPSGVRYTGDGANPLAGRIRVAKGSPMFDDRERFPVVLETAD